MKDSKKIRPVCPADRLSYPCWIFNEEEIVRILEHKKFLRINFESSYDEPYITGFGLLRYKSIFFKKAR